MAIAMMRALRSALPAVIAAAAMTFLFAAVMPLAWVTGISWNLYLDRLSALFEPPVGNGGRLALALGMAVVAALIAGLVALALAKPDREAARLRRGAEGADDADDALLPRRRADFHPDAPPRPPIRAGRDLPAEGLAPLGVAPAFAGERGERELMLADLAPAEPAVGEEPWLQPADIAPRPLADSGDRSLAAMVARLEAGLARRRDVAAPLPPAPEAPAAAPPMTAANSDGADDRADDSVDTSADDSVDFALAAALGTLQRMNRQSVG